MFNKWPIVPVFMFHRVLSNPKDSRLPWLAISIQDFELYLSYFSQNGYMTITLYELYNYLNEGKKIPYKSLILTFDDGYLDTWTNVYPLLKKYGMKGVVWASSDFVVRSKIIRPNLDDIWSGKIKQEKLEEHGYLSEGELQLMESSGIFEVGVHCKTHTRVFSSPNIVDFQNPDSDYYWLAWNLFPECKLSWLFQPVSNLIPLGKPIYEHEWATCTRQYFPDPRLEEYLTKFIKQQGENEFFNNRNWKNELYKKVAEWKSKNQDMGRFESDEELRSRLYIEINEPKKYFEKLLKHPIYFLCWPGGGSCPLGIKLAREVGYLSTTVRSSSNIFGKRPDIINRISIPNIQNFPFKKFINIFLLKYIIGHETYESPYYQVWFLKRIIRGKPINRSIQFRTNLDL